MAMIKEGPKGYTVVSMSGKKLGGPYKSKKKAQERMREVEYFKHKEEKSGRSKT